MQDADRIESGKAAAVAGAAGTLASLPFLLSEYGTGAEAVLGLAGLAASCLLFGVTYRYAVRQDLDRGHLKVCSLSTVADRANRKSDRGEGRSDSWDGCGQGWL